MKELDELITYIENDLIGEHKDIEIIDQAIKKYAELYHKKQLLISSDSGRSDGCYECGSNNLRPKEYNCLDCGHDGYCY